MVHQNIPSNLGAGSVSVQLRITATFPITKSHQTSMDSWLTQARSTDEPNSFHQSTATFQQAEGHETIKRKSDDHADSKLEKKRKTNALADVESGEPQTGAQGGKPEPYGEPLIWAAKRQQLCETTPYYRAYQSGAYTNNKRVLGFMCDKEVTARDVFKAQIIITIM